MAEDAVEARVREPRQIVRVPLDVGDPAWVGGLTLARIAEHLGRDVDACDESAEVGKEPCVLALPAGKGEDDLACDVPDQFCQNGIGKTESVSVKDAAVGVRDLVVCGPRAIRHLGAYWTLANGQSAASHSLTARHSGMSRCA